MLFIPSGVFIGDLTKRSLIKTKSWNKEYSLYMYHLILMLVWELCSSVAMFLSITLRRVCLVSRLRLNRLKLSYMRRLDLLMHPVERGRGWYRQIYLHVCLSDFLVILSQLAKKTSNSIGSLVCICSCDLMTTLEISSNPGRGLLFINHVTVT